MAENQQQGGEYAKILSAYEKNVGILTAILGGDKLLKAKKPQIGHEALAEVVEELFAEEIQNQKQAIRSEVKDLVKQKLAYDVELKNLEKIKIEKMKQFNQACNNLLQKVEDAGTLVLDYQNTLRDVISASPEEQEEDTAE